MVRTIDLSTKFPRQSRHSLSLFQSFPSHSVSHLQVEASVIVSRRNEWTRVGELAQSVCMCMRRSGGDCKFLNFNLRPEF